MVSSLLLALLLTGGSSDCFSPPRPGETWAPPPPGEGEAGEDPVPSQTPETPTALGMNSSCPEGPVSAAGLDSTPTTPRSRQEATGSAAPPGGRAEPGNAELARLFDEFLKPRPSIMAVPGPSLFTLRDTRQKVVRQHRDRLVASPQTANAPPEKISVVPNQFMDPRHFPVIMGVDGGTRCLSCGTSAPPTLRLEDKKIMDLYQNDREARRFTFTCSLTGSTHRFESAAFPGWYLSTSPQNDQPLQVTNRLGEAEITSFYFRKV